MSLELFGNIAILWGFIASLLVMRWLLPRIGRRWPRLAAWLSALLPLPGCRHSTPDGKSLMYRDRLPVDGRDVLFLVCPQCGARQPLIDRDAAARDAIAKVRPAHESMRARIATPPLTPAEVLRADFMRRKQG